MDNEQAKLILSAYRPGGEDASDPFFSDALGQVRRDPELAHWFAGQRRFDRIAQSALQTVSPPKNLRESVLLGNKVMAFQGDDQGNETTARVRPPGWKRPAVWLAVAASFALLLGIGLLPRPGKAAPISGERFAQKIDNLGATKQISLGKMASDPADLRGWLAAKGAPHDFPIPGKLRDLEGMGCQTFDIEGNKVSLVCFMLAQNRLVHLFVIKRDALRDPPGPVPSFLHEGERAAAVWSDDTYSYLLTGTNVDEETLKPLI